MFFFLLIRRHVEGSRPKDLHDWHTDGTPVVHLRRGQGRSGHPPPAAPCHARVSAKTPRGPGKTLSCRLQSSRKLDEWIANTSIFKQNFVSSTFSLIGFVETQKLPWLLEHYFRRSLFYFDFCLKASRIYVFQSGVSFSWKLKQVGKKTWHSPGSVTFGKR